MEELKVAKSRRGIAHASITRLERHIAKLKELINHMTQAQVSPLCESLIDVCRNGQRLLNFKPVNNNDNPDTETVLEIYM